MHLLDKLRYHREALEALRTYGNHSGARAAAARSAFDAAISEIPSEVDRLNAEIKGLAEAGADERAGELAAEVEMLAAYLADPEAVHEVPQPQRKGRRRNG